MPPGGPRSHPAQQPGYGARPPPPGSGRERNEVFESIFGRPSAGHHLGNAPPGHPQRPGYPGAPGFPPAPGGNVLNPAQPSYPPQFPSHQTPPSQQPPQRYSQQQGHGQPQPQPQRQQPAPPGRSPYQPIPDPYAQQTSAYDSVSYEATANGYQRPRGPSYGQSDVPNRRTSLLPSRTPSNPGQNGGARMQPPTVGYNGYPERLAPVSDAYPSTGGMQAPHPHPRSVSATSASSSSTVTANVPPRSRSLHHANGPSKIRVTIPSPSLGDSLMPFPERGDERQPASRADEPPDYIRAMGSVNLDDHAGRTEDMESPERGESGFSAGPWDSPGGDNGTYRPNSSRHMSSGSLSSQRRSMHARQPSDSSISSSIYAVGTVSGQRMAPLSQITNPDTPDSLQSPPTPTGSENGFTSFSRLSGRKSMESTHSLPLPSTGGIPESPLPPGAATSVFDHRATSFSGSGVNRRDVISAVRSSNSTGLSSLYGNSVSPVASQRILTRTQSGARAKPVFSGPIIVALLSNVAEAFRQMIEPQEIVKDGIAYKDSFDGRSAVTIIADIIKTPDRNLALLLGRALDAQKFFHDVTYAHRLRDTDKEVYQFRERLMAPFMSGVMDSPSSDHLGLSTRPSSSNSTTAPKRPALDSASVKASDSQGSFFAAKSSPGAAITPVADEQSGDDLPNGVFTLLTECYSPTCSPERLCYSINCPRRMEQMKRLNMKSAHPGLQSKLEDQSLVEDVKETGGTLWVHSVSQEILDSVDDNEKKRQEAINEIMYTERDFVRALEYLRESWVKPLRSDDDVIPIDRREEFVRQVFWNVHDVLKVNHVLAERLTKRQKSKPVVDSIGDIFLECVPHFEPFVVYGAHQLFGKYEFEKEKGSNPAFQKFVDETERKPESQKLELNGYLTKPTTRLGRYPLLLEAVLKYTPDDHPDKTDLPEVIKMVRAFLTKVNLESGKSENIFELAQLDSQLMSPTRGQDKYDLHLRDKNRQLLHKGPMKRRGGTQGENADLLAFLFDHSFLLVKSKWVNKSTEQYRIYRRPIYLELLVLTVPEDYNNSAKLSASSRSKLMTRNASKGNQLVHVPPKPESKHGFSITVSRLGRQGFSLQLWVESYVNRKKWVEQIEKRQQEIRDKSTIFVPETVTEGFFQGLRRINCLSPYDNGNRMIYGTDEGVYFSNLRDPKLREPVKVIHLVDVTQVDVIEELQLLIVLHERSVTTFPLDCLDPNDPMAALKRGKRVSSHTSFFKSGICLGRTLVAIVKSSPLSSTIKVLEPVDQNMRGKKQQTGFMRRLNGGQDTLKVFKEFYIPLESFSVHFLKTKLCVGCHKGFEIVDLETLDMQSLLDPTDRNLDFVLKRDGVRPMAIYRIEGDFLLCYDEFAFYVNKNGYRARPNWYIVWEGAPTAFALHYPYVIAFDRTFIEIRHVESGELIQVIQGNNISCLFADMPPSTVNAPPPSRQIMYPGGGGQGMYRPPQGPQYQNYGGYPQPQPQFQQNMRPPMGGYGMPPQPMAPYRNLLYRPQVIFTREDGHVQFLKLPPRDRRRSSESRASSTLVSHASSATLR